MAEISFKSVGEMATARQFRRVVNEIPIGIKTPMRLGQNNDGIFAMHFNSADQIRDNFRNLLLTNHGERMMIHDFGANLRELTMELTSDQFDLEAMGRIKRATAKFMPFIDLQSFEKAVDRADNEHTAIVRMRVLYNVPALQLSGQAVELRFYIAG